MIAAAILSSGELSGVVIIAQLQRRAWHLDELGFTGGLAVRIAQTLLYAQREQVLDELRVLAGELMRSQDQERRRIGRELHDSTGQTLAALELDLERLLGHAEALAPAQRAQLAGCAELTRQCAAEIRTASYLLHPPLLDELGLVSALRWLADGFRQRSGMEVRLDLPDAIARLSPEAELTLFRVAQEGLTNAQRHAKSPWIALRLKASADFLELQVEDEGTGVSPRKPWHAQNLQSAIGVGLAGMRERVRQVGGTFLVESTGTGTCIRARVPVGGAALVARA
jgi:two-component system NarL family sensor kinase